ncbi:MAG: stage 0 sporulation family protein [Clostridia bacterium]|nr:stage 0 sporulation family protein [Clostridia bacterium]
MVKITGVNFTENGKIYYFSPGKDSEKYTKGMGVIVDTARGHEYATVVIPIGEVDESRIVPPLRPVLRIATQRDLETIKKNNERKPEAMKTVQEKIAKYKLNMKLIDCDFSFDGSKVVFYYSAPARVDFRELVKELSSHFKMRIELRQLGIRDEIKMIGGIGACGRECCCSAYMPDINKVTIKMAKTQNLSLNPAKISGLCGRLMCCLAYENDYYAEAGKHIPKLGTEVTTPDGKGTVVNINMLKMQVRVKIEDKKKDIVTFHDYAVKDIKFKNNSGTEDKEEEISEELKEIIDKN